MLHFNQTAAGPGIALLYNHGYAFDFCVGLSQKINTVWHVYFKCPELTCVEHLILNKADDMRGAIKQNLYAVIERITLYEELFSKTR